ncbi:MAG TPA: CPBP family intramembrane glutamic endopeptidase [Acidimicrobiia bacterium]|nr:CPBP family intramembrane glutamic endopeptidase [Acidimicrobiia bacterium]
MTITVWRWDRWTRWPLTLVILGLAALTVVVDVGTAWADISLGTLGEVPVSPALPLGLVLAALIGFRRLGLDRANLEAWREFLVIGGAAMLFGVYEYAQHPGGLGDAFGLVVGALGEELVYRLAVLVVVGAGAAKLLGRNWRNSEDWGAVAGVTALLAAGLVFTLLPGHVAQMSDTLHALPFACLGLVLGYAVLRTGALFPAAVVHALLNLTTIAALDGDVAIGLRTALAALALIALVLATIVAGMRLGILRRVPYTPASTSLAA